MYLSPIGFNQRQAPLLLLGLLLLSLALMPLAGQDGRDDERYGGHEVEIIFPVRLRFNLTVLAAPETISSASVVFQPEGSSRRTLNVDLGELEDGDSALLTIVWDVPAGNVPDFNTSVEYNWTVSFADDTSMEIEDRIRYAPAGTTWTRSDDPEDRLSLIVPGVAAQSSRESLVPVYNFLVSQAQAEPELRLALNPSGTPLNPCLPGDDGEPAIIDRTTGDILRCEGRAEASVAQLGYEIIDASGTDHINTARAVVPRMVAKFFGPGWENLAIPDWFEVGLGLFLVPGENPLDLQNVRDLARDDRLFTLDEMSSLPGEDDTTLRQLWLSQAHMMVRYMVSQVGIQGVFLLGRTAGEDDETFEQSYQRTIEQPLEAILPSLKIWIFRQEAERAISIDIYAGPTEIPSPLPTASPFLPTRAPTLTPTITPTPRATFPPTSTPHPTDTPMPPRRG